MKSQEKFRTYLDAEAKKLGFNGVGIANPHLDFKTQAYLEKFVAAGWHGSMGWMADTLERRAKPVNLWPDVKSIIMLSMNYGPETNPLAVLKQPHRGAISVYARHRDYHDVIKGRLKTLASKIVSKTDADVKVFVDTAPVMEKPLAKQAGLGWQGKHTNLVSREFGSWLFLGSIFTTLELSADVPESDNCGSCSDCLDVCPTDAFPAPYQIDARRCISYLTIENKGPIPVEFRKPMGNRIYGCDDCLAVCPWNKFAQSATELKLAAPNEPKSDLLKGFLQLNDVEFRNRFAGSPVKRIGRNRFIRNCLIAAGNSKQENLMPDVMSLTSDDDPVVAEAADWAATELDPT